MTCIVGIVDGNVVLIGSDSAATDASGAQEIQRAPKTFELRIPVVGGRGHLTMVLGFAGCFRVAQAVQWISKVPSYNPSRPLMEYLVRHFVPAVEAAVTKAIGLPKGEETNVLRESSFLIGFQGRLFTLYFNGQLLEAQHGYASIGSGASVALGAMWAIQNAAHNGAAAADEPPAPWTVLDHGLAAAEYLCSGVRRPFHIEYVMT